MIKLMNDAKTIEKAIASIANRGSKLDADIQHCALSVINHVELHGDVTLVNRLYLAMPKGTRKAALSAWLLQFGKVLANTDKASKKELPFVYNKQGKTDMDGAIANPWYNFKQDKAPDEVLNLNDSIKALLKRAESAMKRGVKVEGDIESLRRMVMVEA